MVDTIFEDRKLQPEIRLNRSTDVTPLEHLLLGSSTTVNGELFNYEVFKKHYFEKTLSEEVFTLPQKAEGIEAVNRRRKGQKELVGLLPFLDISKIPKGYQPMLSFDGLIDKKTGKVDPFWTIVLLDKNREKVPSSDDAYKTLALLEDSQSDINYNDFFDLNVQPDTTFLTLKYAK